MVGTRRLELLTFPACRDALMSSAFIDQFLNGAVRFPGFQLPFPTPCFGKSGINFMIDENPRSSPTSIRAVATAMLV
jgi:hypothetical protein